MDLQDKLLQKKLKIFSGLLVSFEQKILWKNIGCFVQGTEREKPENITYTKKKGGGIFSIQKHNLFTL